MMMPRYVVLLHEMPPESERGLHWDLMLERDETLLTWALNEQPSLSASIGAVQLDNHRLAYLDYEGEVSGGRGHVSRWDAGFYQLIDDHFDRLVIQMSGVRLECGVTAEQIASGPHWQFLFGRVE